MPAVIELSAEAPVFRPASEVWALLADYGQDPRWRTGVSAMDAEPPGPARVGTRTDEVLRFGGRTYRSGAVVTAVDPGLTLSWRTTSGIDAEGSRTVTATAADRCVVTLRTRVRPAGLERLLAPVLGRLLQRNLTGDLARLRTLAESAT